MFSRSFFSHDLNNDPKQSDLIGLSDFALTSAFLHTIIQFLQIRVTHRLLYCKASALRLLDQFGHRSQNHINPSPAFLLT